MLTLETTEKTNESPRQSAFSTEYVGKECPGRCSRGGLIISQCLVDHLKETRHFFLREALQLKSFNFIF